MLTVFAKEYLLDLSTFGKFYGRKWLKFKEKNTLIISTIFDHKIFHKWIDQANIL
jgi:hypothetical protein